MVGVAFASPSSGGSVWWACASQEPTTTSWRSCLASCSQRGMMAWQKPHDGRQILTSQSSDDGPPLAASISGESATTEPAAWSCCVAINDTGKMAVNNRWPNVVMSCRVSVVQTVWGLPLLGWKFVFFASRFSFLSSLFFRSECGASNRPLPFPLLRAPTRLRPVPRPESSVFLRPWEDESGRVHPSSLGGWVE